MHCILNFEVKCQMCIGATFVQDSEAVRKTASSCFAELLKYVTDRSVQPGIV